MNHHRRVLKGRGGHLHGGDGDVLDRGLLPHDDRVNRGHLAKAVVETLDIGRVAVAEEQNAGKRPAAEP